MEQIAKSEIFFMVTTVAVVVGTIMASVAAYYVIKILRNLKAITGKAKTQTDLLAGDIDELRSSIKREGVKLKYLAKFFDSLKKKK